MQLKAENHGSAIPPGSYDAILVQVDECSNADGRYLKWTFTVSVDGESRAISGFTSMTLHTGSKAWYWIGALLGRSLDEGEIIDTDRLYGRICRIEVTTVMKGGGEFPKIARAMKREGCIPTPKGRAAEHHSSAEDPDKSPF